jgi:hypothetical protein
MRVVGPPVPFVWTLPADWEQVYKANSTYEDVTAQTTDGSESLVLIENVGASDPRVQWLAPVDSPAPGAKALAVWLASRPYLRTTRPTPTTVGGLPAWELDARIGPLGHDATTMVSGLPGAYLVRVLPPVSDQDTMGAWFDQTYTKATHVWLVDLPNGTVGYIEGGSVGGPDEADIARILQQMHFTEPGSP